MLSQLKLSESEEMYLVTIRDFCEECDGFVMPISELAHRLEVLPVSVNQMVKKLAEAGLVKYTPYKGVELTAVGRSATTRILRYRRLWEVFLVKDLKIDLEEADSLACELEHHTTDDVADRLAEFLEHPTVCFHGSPIPQHDDDGDSLLEGIPLAGLKVGESGSVMQINAGAQTIGFLGGEGISLGVRVRVAAVGRDGEFLLECPTGRVHLSEDLTAVILVGVPALSENHL